LKIRNVESFYNYRTVLNDNEIKIVSSGLSSESQFIELKHFTTGVAKNEEYRIEMENIIPEQDVKLQHLHLKK
jgi:predicted aldo/keto reductase-like oxidoreductase